MRNVIQSLLNVRIISVIIIFQFSLGLYLVNTSNITSQNATIKKNNLDRLFNFETTYFVNIAADSEDSFDYVNNFLKLSSQYNELDKLKREGYIKDHFLYYGGGINPVAFNEDYIPEKYKNIPPMSLTSTPLGLIIIDYNFYKHYNLKITSGRGFTEDDFKIEGTKENIPILLGEDYKELLKVGDVVPHGYPDLTVNENVGVDANFEVIGFYKHNDIPILGHPNSIISSIQYSDSYGIIPVTTDIMALSYEPMICQYGIWIDIGTNENLEIIKKRLSTNLKKDKFKVDFYNVYEEYKTINSIMIKDMHESRILGFIITILSIIGVSAIMIGKINERKKEFGIKIAVGATINKLILEVILENTIICLISSLIPMVIIFIKYEGYLTFRSISSNLIFMFIIIFMVNIIPIFQLKKFKVTELVKER